MHEQKAQMSSISMHLNENLGKKGLANLMPSPHTVTTGWAETDIVVVQTKPDRCEKDLNYMRSASLEGKCLILQVVSDTPTATKVLEYSGFKTA